MLADVDYIEIHCYGCRAATAAPEISVVGAQNQSRPKYVAERPCFWYRVNASIAFCQYQDDGGNAQEYSPQ